MRRVKKKGDKWSKRKEKVGEEKAMSKEDGKQTDYKERRFERKE